MKNLKQKFEKFDYNWRLSLEGGLNTRNKRISAIRHSFWMDHEFLRKLYHNDYKIADGVYRANQPSPKRIEMWSKRGLKSILNFRGETNQGAYFLELEACNKYDIELINYPLFATKLPSKEAILGLETIFKNIRKPFLMHCKSGADRAGLGSALYYLYIMHSPIRQAQMQLSFKYLHIGGWKAGILDFIFMQYRKAFEFDGICFKDWVEKNYDVQRLTIEFSDFRKNMPWLTIPR